MDIEPKDLMRSEMFVIGRDYNRRADIHGRFGGQMQGGISTPREAPFIFLFTGRTGGQYGYEDGWRDEDVFVYTGEGQVRDMEFRAGSALTGRRDAAPLRGLIGGLPRLDVAVIVARITPGGLYPKALCGLLVL
jgi:hypothetical protein